MNKRISEQKRERYEKLMAACEPFREAKAETIHTLAGIGRKYRLLRYPIMIALVAFIFIYNVILYGCIQLKFREKSAKGVALVMTVALVFTGVDVTVFATTEKAVEGAQGKGVITAFGGLDESIAKQSLPVGAEESEINFPDIIAVTLETESDEGQTGNIAPEEDTVSEESAEPEEGEGSEESIESEEGEGLEESIESEEGEGSEESIEPEEGEGSEESTESEEGAETKGDEAPKKSAGSEENISEESKGNAVSSALDFLLPEPMVVYAAEPDETEPFIDASVNVAETSIDVIWRLDTAASTSEIFDSSEEGNRYVYVPVISDEYILAEGVSLPEITVTVQAEERPLTAAGELLEKILEKYFDGLSEDGIYDAILAMDESTRFSLTADYEELLAAMTKEDEADGRLKNDIGEIERGLADAAANVPMRAPVLFRMRAASAASGTIPLRRISGSGNAFVYHSFNETKSFTAGTTYAFLNGIYGYEDAVSSLGSGAILKATNENNGSLNYIRRKYGNSATVKVYVDVVTRGRDFDGCVIGGLYQVPNSGTPTEYRYFCGYGGAQNCGPYYAYHYVKESLSYTDVSASLNNIEKQGSTDPKDYAVKVAFGGGQSMTLDAGSYTVQIPNPNSDEVNIIVADSEGNKINTKFRMPLVVNYDGNGTGVSNVPAIQAAWKGESFTVSSTAPVRSGYSFLNWKEAQTGTVYTKGQRIASFGGASLLLKAQWKDIQAPTVAYTPTQVMTRAAEAEVKAAVEAALTITDNEPAEECKVEITVPLQFTQTAGNKDVTVKVTDKAGNSTTKTCTVSVMSYVEFSGPQFTADTKNLSVILRNPGTDPVTESGFVWGIMNAPSLTINNGRKATASLVAKADETISVTADNLQKGVTYYARAYIIADGVAYYSDEITIGLGLPAYGTFTIRNNNNNTFTVTRSGGSEGTQTVYYRTVNGSAVGGTHFTHQASSLTFAAGVTSQTITISEQGVNAAYSGKPATAYTNADRTYSVQIYRVTGGGTLDSTTGAVRTMGKGSGYTIDRNIYTYKEETVLNSSGGAEWGRVTDAGYRKGGNPSFTVQMPTPNDYVKNTADVRAFYLIMDIWEEDDGNQWVKFVASDGSVSEWKFEIKPGSKGSSKRYNAHIPSSGSTAEDVKNFTLNENSGNMPFVAGEDYLSVALGVQNVEVRFDASGSGEDDWRFENTRKKTRYVDTKEPRFVAVAPMAGGLYKAGDTFTVSLIFDEIVDSQNSGDLNGVKVNTTWGQASYAGGVNTNVLYFTGTIAGNAETTLRVNGFTNPDRIKDMCENTSSTATSSGTGSTTATVDTAKPGITVTSQGIAGGTGTVKVVVNADQSKTNSLRYAWSDSASMPATGWVDASAAELSSAKGAAGLPLSIRKEPGSGAAGNGKWYLHVIGTYSTTGATDYKYACVDFGTASAPAAGSEKPSLSVSADNSAWATQRTITIQTKGGGTLQYRKSGASVWTNLAASAGSVSVTENGYYTFRLTAADNVLTQTVQVEKIDRINPTASIGALKESDSTQSPKAGIYTKLTLPVTFADSGSGVNTVRYAWTDTQTTPSSGWQTLSSTQVLSGKAEISYTASESTETAKYLHVKVTDKLNHEYTTGSASAYKVISQSAVTNHTPKITLTGAPAAWTNDMVTLTWTLTDYSGKNYEVILPNGRTAKSNTSSGEIWATRNGSYTVKVVDKDYGGENTATVQVSYIDTTPPAVAHSEVSGNWQNSRQTVTFSASDSESGVGKKYIKIITAEEYAALTAAPPYPAEGLAELTADSVSVDKNGVWYVYYKYYDKAGDDSVGREANKTQGFVGPIKIDAANPSLALAYGTEGVPESEGLNVSVEARYGMSGGSVRVGDSEITALTASPVNTDEEIRKQTVYKITEKGTYVFALTGGSGKGESKSLTVYEAVYDLQGATASSQSEYLPKLVASGGTLTKPKDPERTGYNFKGWYTAQSGGTLWDFGTDKVTTDRTLYARWADEIPPDKPVLQDGVTLPADWTNTQKTIPLTLRDGAAVTELWASVDGGTYQKVDGFSGNVDDRPYNYEYTEIAQGEHTYQFKAKDAAGNISAESEIFKIILDAVKPVIGELAYENKAASLWQWIIGKKSMIVHVPVTDTGSGVTGIRYILTPKDAGGNPDESRAVEKTATVKGGEAKIDFADDFRGTITISCTDAAGNDADSVTIGADAGGIIVEDRAPDITLQADRNPSDTEQTQPDGADIAEDYYNAAPALFVTVKDDADNTVTAGLASVTYQVGDDTKKLVAVDTGALREEISFIIPAPEISTGSTEIKITAKDNAGNEATERLTIKVKGPEKKPAAKIDYREEKLTGFIPGGEYLIDKDACEADAEGCIQIKKDWFGSAVTIVRKGNGSETTDSPAQSLSIPARPAAPAAPQVSARTEDSITLQTITGARYRLSGGGQNWQDSTKFEGLNPKTVYSFHAYYLATDTSFVSAESEAARIATVPTAPTPDRLAVSYAGETFTLKDGIEAFSDQSCQTPVSGSDVTAYMGRSIYIRYREDGVIPESPLTAVTIPARPVKPAPGKTDASYPGAKDGAITGLTADTAYEYRIKDGNGNFSAWKDAEMNGTTIEKLPAGEYEVRARAVETEGNARFRSEIAVVTIGEKTGVKITFMANGEEYAICFTKNGGALTEMPSVPPKKDAGEHTYTGEWCGDEQGTPAVFTNITTNMTVYAVYTTAYNVALRGGAGYSLSAEADSVSPVKEGGSFTFCFTLESGYQKTGGFAVKVNGVKAELTADGTHTITDIRENYTVTVEGVEKKVDEKPSGSSGGGGKKDVPEPSSEPIYMAEEEKAEVRKQETPLKQETTLKREAAPEREENGEPEETKAERDEAAGGKPEKEASAESAEIKIGNGTVIVTLVCEEEKCGAAVADAEKVVKAVLTPEQQELVNGGETIEIRIDVTDISGRVPAQDKEVIESGIEAYREEARGLVLGMYVDISMFIKIGEESWNAVTETEEPVEVIIGIPETLLSADREFYIIRAHNGEYTFMNDLDDDPDTITVSTSMFSSYAIAYVEAEGIKAGETQKCGLCHICPTFLDICCFVWLAIIIFTTIFVIILLRKKKEE